MGAPIGRLGERYLRTHLLLNVMSCRRRDFPPPVGPRCTTNGEASSQASTWRSLGSGEPSVTHMGYISLLRRSIPIVSTGLQLHPSHVGRRERTSFASRGQAQIPSA